jgi:hypothetical protein
MEPDAPNPKLFAVVNSIAPLPFFNTGSKPTPKPLVTLIGPPSPIVPLWSPAWIAMPPPTPPLAPSPTAIVMLPVRPLAALPTRMLSAPVPPEVATPVDRVIEPEVALEGALAVKRDTAPLNVVPP